TVGNHGPQAATHVVVVDQLPAGTEWQGSFWLVGIPDDFVWDPTANTITLTYNTLAAGGSVSSRTVVKALTAGVKTDTATVSSDQVDPNSADNTASASTTVVAPSADLAVG